MPVLFKVLFIGQNKCYLNVTTGRQQKKSERQEEDMRSRFGIVTIILVMVIAFCTKQTVMSKENNERARQNQYYAVLEAAFLQETKEVLNEQGLRNCGVTMTRVTQENGEREYTVAIHHQKLEKMEEQQKAKIREQLMENEFTDGLCSFIYQL